MKSLISIAGAVLFAIVRTAWAQAPTALMTNHSEFDDAYFKAHASRSRKPGEPNPFDVGGDGIARYFTVVQACTTAARIRATGQ